MENNHNNEATPSDHDELLSKVGQLTRTLHDNLRALGFDKSIQNAAQEIPDVRERLNYVAKMTEQAAQRVLNATDTALPLQDNIASTASDMASNWRNLIAQPFDASAYQAISETTALSFENMATDANASKQQLMDIMMAQDFQDLTGQVIRKVMELAHHVETQLVQLLVDHAPEEIRREVNSGLLNGPVINPETSGEIVESQMQVDDLLDSLGF
ncbi:protein phosphatase CheZ [Sulfuriferula nivalis]|uniref:Protein phosphatase CheZ n=1 Tax=Sulfuriferula nivalis TaxID=2675298 RepID=A0A809RMZ4_9PROT|nr:protein phosphatase CheZ [Sulfuriferula nivalis]BBP02144.1 protein phosphatase CheZ [Sulfuriferula nivalis]